MTLPYRIILVITLLMTIMRWFLIPQWSLMHHVYSFFFQATVMFFLWWMLTRVNSFFNRIMPFQSSVFKRLVIQVTVSLIISSPVLFIVDYLSESLFPTLPFMNQQFKAVVIVLFIAVITLINFIFYGAYFFRQWRKSVEEKAALQVGTAEAEKEKSLIQYQHLKNQVNPHFLFNTLTSLDGLILSDPPLASTFLRHLAKVYRYVLEHGEKDIVTLEEEINFINHYVALLRVRYGNAIFVEIDVSPDAMEKRIAMVTLQMLIDNAIKHNVVHTDSPLLIRIHDENNILRVTNNKQLRKQIESSTKQGLRHLQQFYTFLSASMVEVQDEADFFHVNLPLL